MKLTYELAALLATDNSYLMVGMLALKTLDVLFRVLRRHSSTFGEIELISGSVAADDSETTKMRLLAWSGQRVEVGNRFGNE